MSADPAPRPRSAPPPIHRVADIDPQTFRTNYLEPGVPLLIEAPPAWSPAVWNLEALAELGRDVPVTLEVGDALRGETRLAQDRLDRYIRRYLGQAAPHQASEALPYLSVFDLLEPFPQLRAAMDFSLFDGAKHYERVRAWLGPAGTVTGFHADLGDNLFHQLLGSKQVRLAPPTAHAAMYPSRKYDFMSILGGVDEARLEDYPLFQAARDDWLDVTVLPGQTLFIPKLWWHRVQGLSGSVSVNCFAWSRSELPRYVGEVARYVLHDLGLWGQRGAAHCVCHTDARPHGTGLRAKWLRRRPEPHT
jgi:lysine-specific demethylase 8